MRLILSASLWLSMAVALLAVAQVIHGIPRARGPWDSPNFLGHYAVTMCFLALAWRHKAAIPIAVANAMVVIASQSRASLLALGCGILLLGKEVMSHKTNRWWTRYVLGKRLRLDKTVALALVAGAIFLSHGDEHRWLIWRLGLEVAAQHPWVGWGRTDIILGLPAFYNVALDWTIRTGLVGLVVAAALYVQAWRMAEPALRAMLAAWLVNGLFLFQVWSTTAPLILGLCLILWRGRSLDVPQRPVGHVDAERGRADAYAGAEG